jgi:hypothetical protein
MQAVDKNIFYQIISYMMNVSQEEKIHLLDFEKEDNFKLFKGLDRFIDKESTHKESIINVSKPPRNQPGLWCRWMVKKEREIFSLNWSPCNQFLYYIEWLEYLMENFIIPRNYVLNGSMDVLYESEEYFSENNEDEYKKVVVGTIVIVNNVIHLNGGVSKCEMEIFNRNGKIKKKSIEGLRSLRTVYNFYDSDSEGDY